MIEDEGSLQARNGSKSPASKSSGTKVAASPVRKTKAWILHEQDFQEGFVGIQCSQFNERSGCRMTYHPVGAQKACFSFSKPEK